MATANIILDKGGTNQITIYTTSVEEDIQKKIIKFTPPSSTAETSEPKTTKIIDLLRLEKTFDIDGYILVTDRTKLRNIMNNNQTITMEYDAEYEGSPDKLKIKDNARDADGVPNGEDTYDIKITFIVGESI